MTTAALIKAPQRTGGTSLPEHLRRLEAESIEIIREVAAAFENPVMLYSIGKDSGVMLHLAASISAMMSSRLAAWDSTAALRG